MNRLCIYVTYNREKEIKEYMGYMIKSLRQYTTTIYVVCNYSEILSGEKYIKPYVDGIFYRENVGFDAGAYKDMLCTILGWGEVYKYDELILMNDSFVGPFYDWGSYFNLMKDSGCDFWGMTRNFGGEYESFIGKYDTHVQSYFLMLYDSVLKSSQFRAYWEELSYPKTYEETIFYFEHKLNNLLKSEGFLPMTLTDAWGLTFKYNENPYRLYSLELIRDYKLPVLKKKSLQIANTGFENALEAVEFLLSNRLYPANWLWDLIDGQFYIENYVSEGINCLEYFCTKYKKIYIYGAGVCGRNLALYFDKKGWRYDGFIVSDTHGQSVECCAFKDALIDEDTGIIVSVIHKKASEEIVRVVGEKCKNEQIFVIYNCRSLSMPD